MTKTERFDQLAKEIAKQMGCADFSEAQEKREWDKVDLKLLEEFDRLGAEILLENQSGV